MTISVDNLLSANYYLLVFDYDSLFGYNFTESLSIESDRDPWSYASYGLVIHAEYKVIAMHVAAMPCGLGFSFTIGCIL